MPLEHLELLAVFEAENVARKDGLFDRNGWLGQHNLGWRTPHVCEGSMHELHQRR
jgi:hypothetical protein